MTFLVRREDGRLPGVMVLTVATVALLVLAFLASSCGGDDTESAAEGEAAQAGTTISVAGGTYLRVVPGEFESLASRPSAFLVNVHVPYEGEIEGTDAFLPYNELAGLANELPDDPAALVLVYCQSGRMSSEAAATLVSMGFSNVVDLEGGMIAWKASGRPLLQIPR